MSNQYDWTVHPGHSGQLWCVGEGLAELSLDETDASFAELGVGGDAANTAVMAAACGVRTHLVGRVGDDPIGRRVAAFWAARGVQLDALAVERGAATGLYVSERHGDGLHRFAYHRRDSAGSRLSPLDVDELTVTSGDIVFATGVTAAISRSAALAASRGLTLAHERRARGAFSLNHRAALAPDRKLVLGLARRSDIVFASEADVAAIGAPARADALARDIAPRGELVLTRGGDGACAVTGGEVIACAAMDVVVGDTVAAGDAFAGAYLAARLLDAPIAEALRCATRAAGLACRGRGAASSYPTAADLARYGALT